jgi:MOSC domain-containing protein YiiM
VTVVISVNLAVPRANPAKKFGVTGIDKRPVSGPVEVKPPGPREAGGRGGLIGDQIFDTLFHGGDDRAVYAYAREDLDVFEAELSRRLPNGTFGENLTILGLDVNAALIGERWQVGDSVVLEVTGPRIPCGTFAYWMPEPGWMKTFVSRALPGPYLKVIEPGFVRAGDPVTVLSRPAHDVTVNVAFRALHLEPELLPKLANLPHLTADLVALLRKRSKRG